MTPGAITQGSLGPSLCESFKYNCGGDVTINPGVDTGGVHLDSGALGFSAVVYDKLGVWNGTQWTVKYGVQPYRVRARVKLTAVVPGYSYQLAVIGTQGGTVQVLALGDWCPVVTDAAGTDQATAWVDESILVSAGMVVEVHIKANTNGGVTMKAPSTYSGGSVPNGPWVAGSFVEVTEVLNA